MSTRKHLLDKHELSRLQELNIFELAARKNGFVNIAGVDEAGRGPLAGPVVAAACIIPENIFIAGVDDSKKLTPARREEIFEDIISNSAIHYAVGIVSSEEIDSINIYQATIKAMLQALQLLKLQPDMVLVDGMALPNIMCQKIIQGDSKSHSIASASIIAKVTRDRLMVEYHRQWPQYGFDKHKGYGTARHLSALKEFGPCPVHRFSFEPVRIASNNPN